MQVFLMSIGILASLIKIIYNKLNSELREIYKKIEKQNEALDDIKINLAANYITKKDFKENISATTTKLDKISDILMEKKSIKNPPVLKI